MAEETGVIRAGRAGSSIAMAICAAIFLLLCGLMVWIGFLAPQDPDAPPPPNYPAHGIALGIVLFGLGAVGSIWLCVRLAKPAKAGSKRARPRRVFIVRRPRPRLLWFCFVFSAIVLHLHDPSNPAAGLMALIATIYPMSWLLIFIHEAAHALVALALGMRLFAVHVGGNPMLYVGKPWGIEVRIGLAANGGRTYFAPVSAVGARWRLLVDVAAPPLLHLAILVWTLPHVVWWSQAPDGLWGMALFWDGLALSNALCLLGSAVPRVAWAVGVEGRTDALLFWKLAREPALTPEKLKLTHVLMEATLALRRHDWPEARAFLDRASALQPDDAGTLMCVSIVLIHTGEFAEARRLLAPMLERPDLAKGVRAVVLNNIACADLLSEDPALLAEAGKGLVDRADKDVLLAKKMAPDAPPIRVMERRQREGRWQATGLGGS